MLRKVKVVGLAMKCNSEKLSNFQQKGVALMLFVFMIALVLTAFLLKTYDPASLKVEKVRKTNQALAQAKQALLAYAAEPITGSVNGASLACGVNCKRPGDLPCPDFDNDGTADPPCSVSAAGKLGRLPWSTLGLGDLRDGSGERFWYAVSNQYKNNPRILPLNSDSSGTISYRNNLGSLVYDATVGTGLAAVVIAPEGVLTRADNLVQNRTTANQNIASNYLDVAFGEDNASFFDGTNDGFISGKVLVGGREVVNDVALPITRNEMNAVMEPRVLNEVMQAILYSFCPGRNKPKTRTCLGPTINDYLPDPAAITDTSCLGNADIGITSCMADSAQSLGRLAVGGNTSATGAAGWKNQDFNSILRGERVDNWFQQNGWREFIFYARAPACAEPTKSCTGVGYLTLQNTLNPTSNNKQVVLIAAGNVLSGQVRMTNIDKANLGNFIEDENLLPLDNTFSRYTRNLIRNDKATSIP